MADQVRLRFEDGFEGMLPLREFARGPYLVESIMRDPGAVRVSSDGYAIAWTDADGEDVDFGAENLRLSIERGEPVLSDETTS